MKKVNIHEAKSQLSKYIAAALRGEEVVIHKAGEPLVVLTPWQKNSEKRKGGQWRNKVKMSADFDAPLPAEILKGFQGANE
jgi:prevent-host-death family protein